MLEPHDCNKGPDIDAVKKEQKSIKQEQLAQGMKIDKQSMKIDLILENQTSLSTDLKAAIDRLTVIIETDIGTRKDVEQLKKDREILFEITRKDGKRLDNIEIRNARCDGAGIFENWPTVKEGFNAFIAMKPDLEEIHNDYHAHIGIKRFVPALMTVFSFLILVFVTFIQPNMDSGNNHSHIPDPRGSVKGDVGIPK